VEGCFSSTPTPHRRSLLDNFPQTQGTFELITRWNLYNNSHSYTSDQHWSRKISQHVCLDRWDVSLTLKKYLHIRTLPRDIPDSLHNIFNIDGQLDSDPIHSAFANFTYTPTNDNNIFEKFNGTISPHPKARTLYLEAIASPDHIIATILDAYHSLQDSDRDENMILSTAHHPNWLDSDAANTLKPLTTIHKIATIPANSLHCFTIDNTGTWIRDKHPYPLDITIWLIHSKMSGIKERTTRSNYFAHLRHLKRHHTKTKISPIFDFGLTRASRAIRHTPTILLDQLINQRRHILRQKHIAWHEYHTNSSLILNILPETINSHNNLHNIQLCGSLLIYR